MERENIYCQGLFSENVFDTTHPHSLAAAEMTIRGFWTELYNEIQPILSQVHQKELKELFAELNKSIRQPHYGIHSKNFALEYHFRIQMTALKILHCLARPENQRACAPLMKNEKIMEVLTNINDASSIFDILGTLYKYKNNETLSLYEAPEENVLVAPKQFKKPNEAINAFQFFYNKDAEVVENAQNCLRDKELLEELASLTVNQESLSDNMTPEQELEYLIAEAKKEQNVDNANPSMRIQVSS
ncbi:MAG: hypothetical protein HKM04_07770 [Legionellales bacterium]|nr:hypothetical protein [Legionellales bacterium]